MLKAVLFDLDDTLIDWSQFTGDWRAITGQHVRPVFDYLAAEIHPLDDYDRFLQEMYEQTRQAWRDGRETLHAPHLGNILVETAVALGAPREHAGLTPEKCLDLHHWDVIDGTVTFPDVPKILELLLDQDIKIGIVTNAYQPMWMRDIEMRAHGLLQYFDGCRISAADVGYLKPHPNIFQAAMKCLGVEAAETVFVGDTPEADIAGAQGAGLQAVLRIVPHNQSMMSGLIVPDGAVNSLEELPAILDDWHPGWRA